MVPTFPSVIWAEYTVHKYIHFSFLFRFFCLFPLKPKINDSAMDFAIGIDDVNTNNGGTNRNDSTHVQVLFLSRVNGRCFHPSIYTLGQVAR